MEDLKQNDTLDKNKITQSTDQNLMHKTNHVGTVLLNDIPIVSLYIEGQERLCLAQISNTLLKQFSYNEIHNRRVALGITCVQCTPVQLEILRRAGAMPVSSRRCGMITRREAERLCNSFLGDNAPPRLPDDFAFNVYHKCAWGCHGSFLPSRYNSSRAKCIKCTYCGIFLSPNKFIFHSHRISSNDKYIQPDAANFNSWRRHMILSGQPSEDTIHAWEDVKAMFNGGTRKRVLGGTSTILRNSDFSSLLLENVQSNRNNKNNEILIQKPKFGYNSSQRTQEQQNTLNDSKIINNNNNYNKDTGGGVSVKTIGEECFEVTPQTYKETYRFDSRIQPMSLSHNIMMDYMWQKRVSQQSLHLGKESYDHDYHNINFLCLNTNSPWIKTYANERSNNAVSTVGEVETNHNFSSLANAFPTMNSNHDFFNSSYEENNFLFKKSSITQLQNSVQDKCEQKHSLKLSAFKPVFHENSTHQSHPVSQVPPTNIGSSSNILPYSTFTASENLTKLTSSISESFKATGIASSNIKNNITLSDDEDFNIITSNNYECEPNRVTDGYIDNDDDELVDIETTEDDITSLKNHHDYILSSTNLITNITPFKEIYNDVRDNDEASKGEYKVLDDKKNEVIYCSPSRIPSAPILSIAVVRHKNKNIETNTYEKYNPSEHNKHISILKPLTKQYIIGKKFKNSTTQADVLKKMSTEMESSDIIYNKAHAQFAINTDQLVRTTGTVTQSSRDLFEVSSHLCLQKPLHCQLTTNVVSVHHPRNIEPQNPSLGIPVFYKQHLYQHCSRKKLPSGKINNKNKYSTAEYTDKI